MLSSFVQERTFDRFVTVAMGWILAPHRRRISQSLPATDLATFLFLTPDS